MLWDTCTSTMVRDPPTPSLSMLTRDGTFLIGSAIIHTPNGGLWVSPAPRLFAASVVACSMPLISHPWGGRSIRLTLEVLAPVESALMVSYSGRLDAGRLVRLVAAITYTCYLLALWRLL